jgi:hypothetical protein
VHHRQHGARLHPKGPETVLALGLTSDGGLIVDNLVERKVVRFGEVETI